MGACTRLFCLCASTGDIEHNSSSKEKVKTTIISSKGAAFATLFSLSTTGSLAVATGFLIHRNLLLTTHSNLPSALVAESSVVWIGFGRVSARLVPQRFFITSSILDLTIVGLEQVDSESTQPQPHFLKITCTKPILNHSSTVYLLGHTSRTQGSGTGTNLAVGTGKVVISTDDLIKITVTGATFPPGSAGFDLHGNLAFMLCDPMKLTSKEECESDPLQFGIPLAVICNWLYQHWEGSLDEVTKPRLGPGHSCTSFSLSNLHAFRHTGGENEGISSPEISKYRNFSSNLMNENPILDFRLSAQEQGMATSEICESPRPSCSATATRKWEAEFPKTIFLPLPLKQLFSEEISKISRASGLSYVERNDIFHSVSSFESSCGEVELQEEKITSEETMYSAETMESCNRSCPRVNSVPVQKVGRSQSCMIYHRWSSPGTSKSGGNRGVLRKQQSFLPVRNTSSQNTAFRTSQDYLSPTISSYMKRRNSPKEMIRPKESSVRVSPRWVF